jgi:hypothetical protein
MAESTLSLTKDQLEAEVGEFLGFGRGSAAGDTTWTERQSRSIAACLDSGLRMFYYPSPLPGESASYDWSFIRPTRTIQVASGSSSVDMPDDFGGLEGSVRIVDNTVMRQIRQASEQFILQKRAQLPDRVGLAEWCAVTIPSKTTATKGQRSRLMLFPTADQDYEIEFQYYLLPDSLQTSFPYSLGGGTHSETIKAAVKAAAELYLDNQPGPMMQMFVERMKASVSLDRRMKAQSFGYCGDPNVGRSQYMRRRDGYPVSVTYNGNVFG